MRMLDDGPALADPCRRFHNPAAAVTPYPSQVDCSAHSGRAGRKPALRLPPVSIDGRPVSVHEAAVAARPFCVLRFFDRDGPGGPPVLIVTPFSGQRIAIFGDLIEALVPDHNLYVTDWVDPALIPATEGGFDLDDMIGYIIGFVRLLGSGLHLVGMSQSGVPLLAATALIAAENEPAYPGSLTLMGGLIDTRINPTPMNRMARRLLAKPGLAGRIQQRVIRPVPAGMPGAGRLVYPGTVQRTALTIYLLRRITPRSPTPLHVFQNVLIGDGEPPAARRQLCRDFLSPMNLPGELYWQTVHTLFRKGCAGHRADALAGCACRSSRDPRYWPDDGGRGRRRHFGALPNACGPRPLLAGPAWATTPS